MLLLLVRDKIGLRYQAGVFRLTRRNDVTGPQGSSIPVVGDGSGIERDEQIHREELQLAFRNNAMPLEALHYE